ncbi:hypothetical protein MATL_G00112630 [Megalops atlanticus]|uniref:Uncharacterized protein n=1 Tax=Megalops atlanticus TaxID=7932 RepID=A0A9D3TCP2_MEGAT|nr:hypothetical protein MATL_G00112630 [Megalops atlanticus]
MPEESVLRVGCARESGESASVNSTAPEFTLSINCAKQDKEAAAERNMESQKRCPLATARFQRDGTAAASLL